MARPSLTDLLATADFVQDMKRCYYVSCNDETESYDIDKDEVHAAYPWFEAVFTALNAVSHNQGVVEGTLLAATEKLRRCDLPIHQARHDTHTVELCIEGLVQLRYDVTRNVYMLIGMLYSVDRLPDASPYVSKWQGVWHVEEPDMHAFFPKSFPQVQMAQTLGLSSPELAQLLLQPIIMSEQAAILPPTLTPL